MPLLVDREGVLIVEDGVLKTFWRSVCVCVFEGVFGTGFNGDVVPLFRIQEELWLRRMINSHITGDLMALEVNPHLTFKEKDNFHNGIFACPMGGIYLETIINTHVACIMSP